MGATIGSTPASAAACSGRVLGLPTWYRGISESDSQGNCQVVGPSDSNDLTAYITKIVLNIIEMVMVIIGYAAAFFILYGGFQFIANNGSPDTVAKALKTILNAVIGLVVSLGAVAVVNLIFGIVDSQSPIGIPQMAAEDVLENILNTVYFLGGIVAVIVIIISGMNYSTSSGDPAKAAKAKNMIIYSIIGLVVMMSAFVLTNFIIGRF